jgi:hypothetical protein
MGIRGARAPASLISLLVLGVWAGSAFAGGAIGAASTALTDTVSTDGSPTSPTSTTPTVTGTNPADTTTSATVTTPSFTVTGPTFTVTVPGFTVALPSVTPRRPRRDPAPVTTPTVTATTPTVTATTPTVTRTTPTVTPPPVGGVKVPPTSPTVTVTTPVTAPRGTPRDLVVPVVANSIATTPAATGEATQAATNITPLVIAGNAAAAGSTAIVERNKQRAARARHAGPRRPRAKTRHSGSTPRAAAGTPPSQSVSAQPALTSATTAKNAKVTSHVRSTAPPSSQSPVPAHTGGGRAASAVSPADRGLGLDRAQGLSPQEIAFGGSQPSLASVHGVLSAVLVTLAALVAFAALIGAPAVLRLIARSRAPVGPGSAAQHASARTREELYSEARRQNIKGRSRMNKAQLERALAVHEPASY